MAQAAAMAQASKQNTRQRDTQGEVMLVKASWRTVKRGRKRYYYPLMHIPVRALEELGVTPDDDIEFELRVERRGGEKVLVLRPRKKAAAPAAAPA
ncbi:hypothetical protein [Pyrodictium abyssi]|uniref:SpoVT-AbrB domain-containing protein n=1 Tax=Pyrodictium abyssi TaxID=54256 RepID=A0ABN6ZS01_9CREN|nr:hypothetical protein PABY_08470 [Pyrodictium abyssi]